MSTERNQEAHVSNTDVCDIEGCERQCCAHFFGPGWTSDHPTRMCTEHLLESYMAAREKIETLVTELPRRETVELARQLTDECKQLEARLDAIHVACCESIAVEDEDDIDAIRRAGRERSVGIKEDVYVTLDFYTGGGAYAASIGDKDGGVRITSQKASPGTTIRSFSVRAGDILDALRVYARRDDSKAVR